MRMYDLIEKKKRGEHLSKEELRYIINGYTNNEIPDYQMSAFLMAVCFKGMNEEETCEMTMAMAESGSMLNLEAINGIKVDKHSTGGVGDKTSMALGPIVASCGVPVAKMSGRGLGFTGGTIDKLESIEGFNTSIAEDVFIKNVNEIGIAIAGQTANLAPADKKIYALRDVTATVDCMPLIASSIMSKKLASGADAIVLDVKCGNGAFMKNEDKAIELAEEMVKLGKNAGREMVAVVTDMNQPLGINVGNALEVIEAIKTLKGEGPEDFTQLCTELGANMIMLAKVVDNYDDAVKMIKQKIESGEAFNKFVDLVKAQGGNPDMLYDTSKFAKASIIKPVVADMDNVYVKSIITENIGKAALVLGGGRITKDTVIDMSVGVEVYKKIGDIINKGDVICMVHGNDEAKVDEAIKIISNSYEYSNEKIEPVKLIKKIVK